MEKICRFFECLLPTTQCNLECEYCYIIQEKRRSMEQISLEYSVDHIVKALSKNRIGGVAFFSICGAGETLLQKETVELVHQLLQEGHYVNITTNGTISKRIDELLVFREDLLKHLHFSFSLHYLELKQCDLLEVFFDNMQKVRGAGCSILLQMNLYDGYMPYLEEIKKVCKERVGAYPQLAVTRYESSGDVKGDIKLYTELSFEDYADMGREFNSPLFQFTIKNFNVKRREFCYAGDWSFNLNLQNGNLKACYHSGCIQNIFKDISKPIVFKAVGNGCRSRYCINSSHFISWGVIPEIKCKSYGQLRNRKDAKWYSEEMEEILSQKLYSNNKEYSSLKRSSIIISNDIKRCLKKCLKRK